RFESQGPDEILILLLRAHPFTQIPWIINTVFIALLLLVLFIFISPYISIQQSIFLLIFGTIFLFSYVWFNFLSWFFNVGIITNEKIIDMDYHGIIYKEITATHINRVEDITVKSGGYFESFFDYGDIFIQTAGKEANIEFDNVPRSSEVVKIINELIAQHGKSKSNSEHV
ncbi:MAG: PH domain-containing protein, partial [bacterium]|nr:PH domain-containing protein [bacterium]